MTRNTLYIAGLSLLVTAAACSKKDDKVAGKKDKAEPKVTQKAAKPVPVVDIGPPTSAPAAPAMPAGWTVVTDLDYPAHSVLSLRKTLGPQLLALRNTTYHVNGKRVKVNTIVAKDVAGAAALLKKVRAMKPAEFSFRRDKIVFEFVGTNDALPDIRAGRAHLQKQKK